MPSPFEISDRLTEDYADLHPLDATVYGIAGRDHLPTDFSPDGAAARAALFRSTRAELTTHLDHSDPVEAFAARVLAGWLDTRVREHEEGKWSWYLSHLDSPYHDMTDVFDVMAKDTAEDWEAICARLEAFPSMIDGYMASLQAGRERGMVAARRQVESVIDQAEEISGNRSRFLIFPSEAEKVGADAARVSGSVDVARAACGRFAQWLRSELAPAAPESDAAGEERYRTGVDQFLGKELDLAETYDWGWSEVRRLMADMDATAAEVDPSLGLAEVIELLETDAARCAGSREEFVAFVSAIQDQAITQLDGTHFDLTRDMKRITVNIAPPGGPLGAWYVGPSEDWVRPGSIWYAPGSRQRIPYWQEVSTAYHEGFPGHHLQVCFGLAEREKLSRFHRTVIWYSGAGEGWALYAERLMDELGYFERPEYRLGLLASQLFRATRVVVDIGCHLGYRIPEDAPLHGGEEWGYPVAVDYMEKIGLQPRDIAESEVKRYLGWWAQAISYKVGEREILAMRDAARARGPFDLKDFHRRMLQAGAIRLDHLWDVMS